MNVDSSLIFLVVIGLWLAYLVPTWLRRREQMSASRASDRFSAAMRVLSRRPAPSDRPRASVAHAYVLTPPASVGEPASPVEEPAAHTSTRQRLPRAGIAVVGLLVLSALAVPASVALAAVTVVPGWSPAAPGGVVVVLVGALRLRARRRARRAEADGITSGLEPLSAVSEMAQELQPLPDGDRGASGTPQRELQPGEWTPVPVPLPSYLLKDEVPRRGTSRHEPDDASRWFADWREAPVGAESELPDVDEDDIPTYSPPARRALGA
jgi:hypothetical protein